MIIENMTQAPIVGYYNENIVEFAKKVAQAYNNSVNKTNVGSLLGYDLDIIPEIKGKKANFSLQEGMLEIILSKNTQVLLPSLYVESKSLHKYFTFENENKLDEILLEKNILQKHLLSEAISVKGAATSAKKNIRKGIESAKEIFSNKEEVEIKSPETIEEICDGIEKDLQDNLNFTPGRDMLIKTISGFVRSGSKKELQDFYNILFESAIESKYIDKVVSDIHDLCEEKLEYGEYIGKVKDKNIIKTFAKAYGETDTAIIKQRLEETGALKKINKIKRIGMNWLSVLSNGIKGLVIGATAISTALDGLIATMMKSANLVLKLVNALAQFFVATEESVFEKLWNTDWWGAGETLLQKFITGTTWLFSSSYDFISSNLVDSITKLESKGLFICIRVAALAYFACLMSALWRETSNAYFRIDDDTGTDAESVLSKYSKERLKSNFGFDKALATDAILAVIVTNVTSALENKNSNLSKEEEKRLKELVRAIYKSHKEKTKEGIRTFIKEASSI